MKTLTNLTNLLSSIIFAAWIFAIALISIQNITPISLKFFTLNTIELPFGIVLAFSVGAGVILGAILPLFFRRRRRNLSPSERDPLFHWEEGS